MRAFPENGALGEIETAFFWTIGMEWNGMRYWSKEWSYRNETLPDLATVGPFHFNDVVKIDGISLPRQIAEPLL